MTIFRFSPLLLLLAGCGENLDSKPSEATPVGRILVLEDEERSSAELQEYLAGLGKPERVRRELEEANFRRVGEEKGCEIYRLHSIRSEYQLPYKATVSICPGGDIQAFRVTDSAE